MNSHRPGRFIPGNFTQLLFGLLCFVITDTGADTVDTELDALEREIRQLEKEQAEARRKSEAAAEAAISVYFQAARPAPVATTVVRSTADAIQPRELRNARLMMCRSLGSDVVPGAS